GLSVGKKLGNAVMRNRIKRYLRQAFLELEGYIRPTTDIIIIARYPTRQMNFHDVKKSLVHLLSNKRLLFKKYSAFLILYGIFYLFNGKISVRILYIGLLVYCNVIK